MAKRKTSKKPLRRKAKATQAETVEVRAPGMGDNSQLALPAPDDYEHHMKAIRGAKDKLETAKSLLSHAKTSANKTCPGLAASIAETLQIERDGDPVKLQKRFELLGMGLKQIGSSIQLSVFDTLVGEVSDQAYQRGHDDGAAGKTANNRYPEGSPLATAYTRGWMHGTGRNMGKTPAEVDAALAADTPAKMAAE